MTRPKNFTFLIPTTILIIFIINLIQGKFTELLADEAYYWVYSQHLAWGFFDHPPMVALWIYISDFFFTEELGVRFFSAISFSILTYIVWKTIDHPRKESYKWLFLLLFFSTALLNVYGFITTPDTPLLVFCALFLLAYKKYLKKKNSYSYVLLTLAITGMMYSKYQGILMVLFLVISNGKLIKDYKLWLVCLGALILYIPHLHWQFINDFPSIRYHLYERASVASYKFEYTLMHFVNAIAIIGFTCITIYKAFFKGIKNKDLFHKGLNYIISGFFIFFLMASFRGHVQAQWIAPIMIPLILITFNYLVDHKKYIKKFTYLAVVNISIIIFARIIIANEGVIPIKLEFHGNKEWTTKVKELTKNTDKLFINSFQNTAIYWFYTKEKSHYQRNYLGRKNQFELFPDNTEFTSDSIAYFTKISKEYSQIKMKSSGKDSIFISFIKNYQSLFEITINFIDNHQITLKSISKGFCDVIIQNPYDFDIELKNIYIELVFKNKKGDEIYTIPTKTTTTKVKSDSQIITSLEYDGSLIQDLKEIDEFTTVGIGIKTVQNMDLVKVSALKEFQQ